jgi:glycosyltransferase involved in cell wall biosynthesis
MKQVKVVGDPNNTPSCSSQIIISSLNDGLQKLGLYDDNGQVIVYDCLANNHNFPTSHIICPYETTIPSIVRDRAQGITLIGVSNQNQTFFVEGGHPKERTDVCLLGVDTKFWAPLPRTPSSKFVFGMMCDSNTRAAYNDLFYAFSRVFGGSKDVCLYIKDRWATEEFKKFVKQWSDSGEIEIIHDDTHITNKEQEREIYNNLDAHIFLNRSSTFALTVAQGMAMMKPTIVMDYSGPRDYCNELNSCLVDFTLQDITERKLIELTQHGFRNYLLTHPSLFPRKPQWAEPVIASIESALRTVYEDREYRERIAYNARVTAQSLTWEKSAATLSYIVSK